MRFNLPQPGVSSNRAAPHFEGRFDIILTNPPFGANVEPTDRLGPGDVRSTDEQRRLYEGIYGDAYRDAQARVQKAAEDKVPIASLFDLPKRGDDSANRKLGKVKTEILFIERCLSLLKPGGRFGIVLPEGIFNNPSLAYVREFCEDRAFIRAVVSLPQETFYSAGATVKASLLFMQKFTDLEAADFEDKRYTANAEIDAKYQPEIDQETARIEQEIAAAKRARDADARKTAQAELARYLKRMTDLKTAEARQLLKDRFDYPIFLYDAQHVGITATGEQDTCELYPNDTLGFPPDFSADDTALVQYRCFRDDPSTFFVTVSDNDAAHEEDVDA